MYALRAHISKSHIYIYIYILWGARAQVSSNDLLSLGLGPAWVAKATPKDWGWPRPNKNRPSPTIGIPRSRKYRLGNVAVFGLGLLLIDNGRSMMKWLNSYQSPSTDNAFGKFTVEHYLVSGINFKRIFRRYDCF